MPSGVLIPITVTIDGVKKTFPSITDLALHVGSNRSAPITWRSRNPDRPIQDWVDKQVMRKVSRARSGVTPRMHTDTQGGDGVG